MDAALIAHVSNLGSGASSASAGTPLSAPADATETSRFASMLGRTAPAPVPPTGSPPSVDPVATDATVATHRTSLGDAILDRIQAAGASYDSLSRTVVSSLQSTQEHVGMRDMLRLQFGISELSLQLELYSKGVGKLLQHVDQLTKLQ